MWLLSGRGWAPLGRTHHLRTHIRKATSWRMFLFCRWSALPWTAQAVQGGNQCVLCAFGKSFGLGGDVRTLDIRSSVRSAARRSAAVAAMDCLLVLWHSGACRFHPLKSSKQWNSQMFQQLAAYLGWSTGLYLAGSGSIVLIFWWTLRLFFSFGRQRRIPFFHHLSVIQHGQFFFSFPSLWLGDSFAKAFTLWSWCIREFTFLFADMLLAGFLKNYCYVWVNLFFLTE